MANIDMLLNAHFLSPLSGVARSLTLAGSERNNASQIMPILGEEKQGVWVLLKLVTVVAVTRYSAKPRVILAVVVDPLSNRSSGEAE